MKLILLLKCAKRQVRETKRKIQGNSIDQY